MNYNISMCRYIIFIFHSAYTIKHLIIPYTYIIHLYNLHNICLNFDENSEYKKMSLKK